MAGSVSGDKDVYDEINITPMLDLAYVLLVIFIIMTTATVQGIKVNLPKASAQPSLAENKTKAITIAASGDVNVNAIAPGIAAALVATVAGLGVAIPCLFGYNWLNTRIKSITVNNRVFLDEFVARLAEQYS